MTTQPTAAAPDLTCRRATAIADVAAAWDGLVPRDQPHLRGGFLRAVEAAGFVTQPTYLVAERDGVPAGVALAYLLRMDGARRASEKTRQWVAWVRKFWPGFFWRPMRVCGSAVSNAESGVYVDLRLPEADRREVFRSLMREVVASGHISQAIYVKEFAPPDDALYGPELERDGFFRVSPGPNMRLDLPWPTFDDYTKAMRKRYRKLVAKDLKVSAGLEFELLDSFAHLAPRVAELYEGVHAQADYALEKVNAAFFAALSDFDQARLLVARVKGEADIAGANLLLFGDTVMQNLFIGFDYERNKQYHLYFSLVTHSLRHALERGCKVCLLGQDSYDFKARLGAKPVPLTAYMKHRIGFVHNTLYRNRNDLFPGDAAVTHDVFQGAGGDDAD